MAQINILCKENFIVVFAHFLPKSGNISVISYDIFPNICHTSCLVHTALRNSSQFVLKIIEQVTFI